MESLSLKEETIIKDITNHFILKHKENITLKLKIQEIVLEKEETKAIKDKYYNN